MPDFIDARGRTVRLTKERLDHLETDHPEMRSQTDRIAETLSGPERIVSSRSDATVQLYYRLYKETPVTTKFLCVVVKNSEHDGFIITAYYTDAEKKGAVVWPKT